MPDRSISQCKTPGIWVYVLLTVTYIITGKLGMLLSLPPSYAVPIFLPAGIAVAAALIGGLRALPWIFIGGLVVAGQSSHAAALIIATASMLQAALGGWALRRTIGYPTMLEQKREVLHFLIAIPLICLVCASLAVTGLWLLDIVGSSSFLKSFATWWVGDTLGVMIMFPLTMIIAGEPRALWRSRLTKIAVPMVLIFAVFVVLYIKSCQWERADSLSDFRQISQQSVDQVQAKFEEQATLLEQMAEFFLHDQNGHVTRAEFHRFVQKSLQRFSMIQALEWAPYLDATNRADFVAEQRHDYPDFDIRERDANGVVKRAGDRSSYYPVTYLEPLAGNEPALGFDLISNERRKETIARSIYKGNITASAAVKLVQENQQQAGVLLLHAIHPHDAKSDVVLTVLRMGDFMGKTLLNNHSMLYTRLIDLDDKNAIYSNFSAETDDAIFSKEFEFGARHYRIETAPTPAYYTHHVTWGSWFVLVVGSLFTGLLGGFLLVDTGHAARIKSEVIDRTRRLAESESRIRFIMENSPIALRVATIDTGRVLFANQAYANLIHMSAEQVIGVSPKRYYVNPQEYEAVLEKIGMGERVSNKLVALRIPEEGGDIKWALASYMQFYFDEQQAVLGWFYDISEQKQIEEQIQLLLNEQKTMLENDLIGIVRVKNRVITWANPSFERMMGYEKGELNGKPTRLSYISDQAYQDLGEAAYPILKSGNVYRTQLEHVCKDGRVIWVDISGSILNAVTGESLWAFLDITERKHAESALQNANQQLNLLLDSMAEGVYGVDIHENCTFVNHSFLQTLGYLSQDDVVGKHIHELIHHSHADGTPYDASECLIYASHLRNENLHCADEVFWHRLGVPIPVEYWSRPIINDGLLTGGIVTFIDISERKEAEEKLRYSEQRFHDVSDAAGEYLWELDANMIYTYVSARSVDVKGYTPEELIGRSPVEFMPEEDIENVGNIINRAIASRGPFKLQHRDITKSGAVVWEEVNGVPIYDKSGEIIGLRGTGLNISERKEMEDRVHQLAFYDPLTSLPNRRLLNDRLGQAMSAGERSGLYGALMFLDLDNFKPLNDTHGHGVGDLLLIEAASRLKKCVRSMDTVARFGGDEFVVMLSELDVEKSDATEQAKLVAEKILAALSEPYVLKASQGEEAHSVEHQCTASIGVTVFLNHVSRQDDILKQADAAMYAAKAAGRNSIRFHETGLNSDY